MYSSNDENIEANSELRALIEKELKNRGMPDAVQATPVSI